MPPKETFSSKNARSNGLPTAFCWTKMGGESGEELQNIFRRKELERRANQGIFVWGIGSSLGDALSSLAKDEENIRLVFSQMRSKTKKVDNSPGSILLWLGYYTQTGSIEFLPEFSLVTSRGETEKNSRKRSHFALFCHSTKELSIDPISEINAEHLVNYTTGKPLGFSQVTAVVKHSSRKRKPNLSGSYPVSEIVDLATPYFAKLALPVSLDEKFLSELDNIVQTEDVANWKYYVSQLRGLALKQSSSRENEFDNYQAQLAL